MHTSSTTPTDETAALRHALCARLGQLQSLASSMTPDQYTVPHGPGFYNATIGGHVRHCLDHVRAVIEGVRAGRVEYDHRERGTLVESSPTLAATHTSTLIEELAQLEAVPARFEMELIVLASHDEPAASVRSTCARELAFVLSHTIHHQAIIHAMLSGGRHGAGQEFPPSFGLAPSTIAHQSAASCAH